MIIFISVLIFNKFYCSDHKTRLAIDKKNVRNLLLSWCKGNREKAKRFQLVSALSSYAEIYESFMWTEQTYKTSIPNGISNFFKCLAKASPVCSYLPPTEECFSLVELLFKSGIKLNSSSMRSIYNKTPIFYNLLMAMGELTSLPLQWKPLIYKLIELSRKPFIGINHVDEVANEDAAESMSFFPSLPVIRKRGRYAMDKVKDEKLCTKNYTSHKNLTAGIFTLYCIHGK